MKRIIAKMPDFIFTALLLAGAFFLNLVICDLFETTTLTPMIFVLSVFLISVKTKGFFWGIAASIIGVFLVNYAFT